MKILMTGHTSPMGNVLFKYLKHHHEVVGISRNTGYDLNKLEDIQRVVEQSVNYDHFINLAHVENAQIQLLMLVHKKWSETNKTGKIITFGTLGTELSENILKQVGADLNYIKQKIHLENVHRLLSVKTPFGTQPQSILIRILNYGEKAGVRQSEPFCDTQDIIRIFNTVLNEPLYISTIDVRKI
jgi:hypothetical protein